MKEGTKGRIEYAIAWCEGDKRKVFLLTCTYLDFVRSSDDCSASGSGDSVVVCLAESGKRGERWEGGRRGGGERDEMKERER